MFSFLKTEDQQFHIGLSNEIKPICHDGSVFLEVDTGKMYYMLNHKWEEENSSVLKEFVKDK